MPPSAVAAFVKKWFDATGPVIPEAEPRLCAMRPDRYTEMIDDWQETLRTHLPSALDQADDALNAVLYQLNITLRVTDDAPQGTT